MYRKEIEAYIDSHREEMIADIIRLCAINSEKMPAEPGKPFGAGPKKALDEALAMAAGYGFRTADYDGYAGTVDLGGPGHELDILAHLDVVPAQEGWTVTEAFRPLVKDGKIFGRGTSDDKGPAVAALYAFRAVRELGIPLKKGARLILGTDEENGSACIAHYYEQEKEAAMTFSPDGDFPVVNIEKGRLPGMFSASWEPAGSGARLLSVTGGRIENAVPPTAAAVLAGLDEAAVKQAAAAVTEKTGVTFTVDGGKQLTVTAHGVNAHASTPQEGKNALTALLLLLTELPLSAGAETEIIRKLYGLMPYGETDGTSLGIAAGDQESGELTLAFSQLKLDEHGLQGLFDCRYPVSVDPQKMVRICSEKFAAGGLTFDGSRLIAPHCVPSDSPFVKELLRCYEDYTGLPGSCIYMGGGTYVHDLKNGVAFGAVFPGTDTRMHAPDEFVVIGQLTAAAKIFAQVIADLCG